MKILGILGLLLFVITAFPLFGQTAYIKQVEFEIQVDIEKQDSIYLVKLQEKPQLFYYYIISGEPIPELQDKDLFVNIVDAEYFDWPILEAGYIDTRFGVNEFPFNLQGKNLYLMGTNGKFYSKITQFDFH